MAATDPVVEILKVMAPAANYATEDVRAGGSTPAESTHVWDFDDTTTEYIDFLCVLRGYDGGGVTFTLPWSATSATTGQVRWGIAIRRVADDAEDLDASHTYDFNTVDDTAASASGELSYPTITFTDGADMDSWADGELAIVRVQRVGGEPSGSPMTGDAELLSIIGKETA